MYLTGEGALLAVALTGLVLGLTCAWALLRVGVARPKAEPTRQAVSEPGGVRLVVVPRGAAPKV
jgi:hypothetical protein